MLADEKVELAPDKQERLRANNVQPQEITLGVRPEHTDLDEEGGVVGTVDVAKMMGSSVHLHITAENRDVIIIVPTVDMKGNYKMGDPVRFSFKGNVAHVFSKETDKNLQYRFFLLFSMNRKAAPKSAALCFIQPIRCQCPSACARTGRPFKGSTPNGSEEIKIVPEVPREMLLAPFPRPCARRSKGSRDR